MNGINDVNKSLLGLYCNDPRFLRELNEVQQYYDFYEGRTFTGEEEDYNDDKGQLWRVKERDYKPTREIRNLVKKLMKKQGRFMTSVPPTLTLSSIQGEVDREGIDAKRGVIEDILKEGKFWNKMSKAFMDCTIGKRVLLAVIIDKDNEEQFNGLKFRFYTMPEFNYEFDPNDFEKLMKVQIAYQDATTVGKVQQEQRWHRWTYEMKDNECWATYQIVDGIGVQAYVEVENKDTGEKEKEELIKSWNTGLSIIPCKIIFNDSTTGDIRGHSDIKDLMDMAMDYNRTVSDYRDALKFRMFEQDIFVNADPKSIEGIKISPGAMIDLKGDPALGTSDGSVPTPSYGKLSSTFNFQSAADSYLNALKKDMYEIMDQPLPESLVNVASGKALRMLNDDLIARCEEKWQEWDEALRWLVDLIVEVVDKGKFYRDMEGIEDLNLNTSLPWLILHKADPIKWN